MSPERWLVWADRAYFGMAIVAAIATALTIVAGITQNRLSARISDAKDRAFADFKLATERQALTLRAEVATANAQAAEANKTAEQERLARIKIEERLAPRVLSPSDAQRMYGPLLGFPGQPVDIFVAGESQEMVTLTQNLVVVLKVAGWQPLVWTWTGVGGITGLIIATKEEITLSASAAADALAQALNQIGLQVAKQQWLNPWDHFSGMLNGPSNFLADRSQIRLIVGAKPQ